MPSSKEIKDFEKGIEEHPDRPRVICFGDSWFNYPFQVTDLNKQIERLYRKAYFYNESVLGRESGELKKLRLRLQRLLQRYQFDVMLLSMGGNDVVGSELREFIKYAEEPQDFGTRAWGRVPALVNQYIHLASFESALRYIASDYQQIIDLRNQERPSCEIVMHNYDYPWPDGKPYKLIGKKLAGPWIKPYMEEVGVTDFASQRIICSWLIDQFTEVQRELAGRNQRVRCVDSRGLVLKNGEWDNEIHPKRAGFKRIAEVAWKPVLDPLLHS
ncbi:MAG: GDSL-type esterase/lipase family protein [Arenimonas sp.]